MSDGEVRFALHDGETLTVASGDVGRVYENLWRLALRPAALTVAGILVAQSRQGLGLHPFELTEPQGAIIREAIALPDA